VGVLDNFWAAAGAVRRRLAADRGQVLLEYALLLALIALATIGTLEALGADLRDLLNQVSSDMSNVTNP
jgi:Flp pilus assembly pilin Flp